MLQQKIIELRVQGLSTRAIAEELFEKKLTPKKLDSSDISRLLTQALDQIVVPEAEKLKKLELERLDNVINAHYGNAVNGDVGATHALLACIDRGLGCWGSGRRRSSRARPSGPMASRLIRFGR